MASTACTCIRAGVRLVVPDPGCPAPSHLWDQIQEVEHEADQ